MIEDGKSQLKDELKAEKERLNRDLTDAYEDITGERVDFNAKDSRGKLAEARLRRKEGDKATKVSERIGQWFRDAGRGL